MCAAFTQSSWVSPLSAAPSARLAACTRRTAAPVSSRVREAATRVTVVFGGGGGGGAASGPGGGAGGGGAAAPRPPAAPARGRGGGGGGLGAGGGGRGGGGRRRPVAGRPPTAPAGAGWCPCAPASRAPAAGRRRDGVAHRGGWLARVHRPPPT